MPKKQYESCSRGCMSQNYGKIHMKATICVPRIKLYAHVPNFSNVCALSNLVSLSIKFDVCSKAFSHIILFNDHETCTTNEKCICCGLQHRIYHVYGIDMLMNVRTLSWSWEPVSCSLNGTLQPPPGGQPLNPPWTPRASAPSARFVRSRLSPPPHVGNLPKPMGYIAKCAT